MSYEFSEFGEHLARGSGIGELMDDLGHALASGGKDILMLGGGQPAHIPAVDAVWKRRLSEMLDAGSLPASALTSYDPPQGNPAFLHAIAKRLHSEFGWELSEENIAVTSGGQTAFYLLFNLLAGRMTDGRRKHILLPLVPEYIGYACQGVDGSIFRSCPPIIEEIGEHEFKYKIDFDRLQVTPDTAAICASRPTNPSGNVLTNDEVAHLADLAKEHDIPLILDNAYGLPFPGIIFNDDARPFWQPHCILTLSLSKIGLPSTRTGIVVGPPEIIRAISSMNAIVGLANPGLGQQITLPLLDSGELLAMSRDVVRPYYQEKCQLARAAAHEAFGAEFPAGKPWRMHASEGALFLWLWFPGLPATSQQLYERLKKRGVLVIPGHHFFYGHGEENWPHAHECIRVSYAMDEATVRNGIRAIAQEVAAIHAGR